MKFRNVLSVTTVLLAGVLLMSSCTKKSPVSVRIAGSTTISSYIRNAVDLYAKSEPGMSFTVSAEGSIEGIDELLSGNADIAMSSSEITPEQVSLAKQKSISLKAFLLGYDIIVPIVNKSNSVDNITMNQLRDIYAGTTFRWSALGGADTTIDVVDRGAASGTHAVWYHALDNVANGSGLRLTESGSNSSVLAYVAGHANSIGYISTAYLNPEVKALNLDGMNIGSNDSLLSRYQLKRPLLLYVNEARLDHDIRSFIVFLIMSDRGRQLLSEAGFFSVYSPVSSAAGM